MLGALVRRRVVRLVRVVRVVRRAAVRLLDHQLAAQRRAALLAAGEGAAAAAATKGSKLTTVYKVASHAKTNFGVYACVLLRSTPWAIPTQRQKLLKFI